MRGFPFAWLKSRPRLYRALVWGARLVGVAVLAIGLEGAVLVGDGLHERLGKADVGVVLGNRVNGDYPSRWLAARLDRAAALYKQGYFSLVVVSGAVRAPSYDEPTVMKAYLVAHGVPDQAVAMDPGGFNTWETARDTAALMKARGLKSAMMISEFYHMPRTRLAMKRFGVTQVYTAQAFLWRRKLPLAVLREMVAYPVYWLRPHP